jgi:hypothetical protein
VASAAEHHVRDAGASDMADGAPGGDGADLLHHAGGLALRRKNKLTLHLPHDD